MAQLRIDPWRSDFGSGAEVDLEGEVSMAVTDPHVETTDWSRPIVPAPQRPEAWVFVDGVMRSETNVMAAEEDRRAWGRFGSVAAGGVRCDGAATFVAQDRPIRRVLVVGSRVEVRDVTVTVGNSQLHYPVYPVADDSPQGLRIGLQRAMFAEEQQLAMSLVDQGLVFVDGRLSPDLIGDAPIVGVVKRMVRAYLDGAEAELLGRLAPGQRTPLFAFGSGQPDRFAFHLRLIPQEASWHELAGLVRCEVPMGIGRDAAIAIADRVACHLPSFAGRPGVDPRAPQNLNPVGALEARLKHRLGSRLMIERALKAHLTEAIHA
ncbi:MAG: hypothetical protein ACRDJT_02120 [Actinomycetota bacterium]